MMRPLAIAALAGLALGACSKGPKAPTTPRVCYHMAELPDGERRFNVVQRDVKNIEFCAVALERMRLHFLRLGGDKEEIVGTYGGQYIFLRRDGVFTARSYDGVPYLLLRRHSGNLVVPGIIQGE